MIRTVSVCLHPFNHHSDIFNTIFYGNLKVNLQTFIFSEHRNQLCRLPLQSVTTRCESETRICTAKRHHNINTVLIFYILTAFPASISYWCRHCDNVSELRRDETSIWFLLKFQVHYMFTFCFLFDSGNLSTRTSYSLWLLQWIQTKSSQQAN